MLRTACLLLTSLIISGCAYNDSIVRIDFKPPALNATAATSKPITVETLTDQRGKDPLVLGNKGVQFKTTGRYTVETPVANIVTNAIRDSLASLKYNVTADAADLVLSGELLRLESDVVRGFWSGELDGTVQVSLKLTNRATGNLLWTQTFTGFGKKTGLQIDHEGHRRDVTEMALADLVTKIAASPTLRLALEKAGGG